MAKELTPGEKAALFLTLGEQLVAAVKETGLLKPKRKVTRKKRKAKKVAKEAPAVVRTKKPKPAPVRDDIEEGDEE